MKTKVLFLTFILGIVVLSCKKDDPINNHTPDRPNSMSELKASPNFNWQTTNIVTLKLKGSHIMTTTVKSLKGDIFFRGLIKPNSDINTNIALPATVKEVIVTYGPFTKTITIVNNTIDHNFNLNSY